MLASLKERVEEIQLKKEDIEAGSQVVNAIVEIMLELLKDDPIFGEFRPSNVNTGSYYEKLKVARPNEFDVMLAFEIPIQYIKLPDLRYVKVRPDHPLNEELLTTTSEDGTILNPAPPQYVPVPYAAPPQYGPNMYPAPPQYGPNQYAAPPQYRPNLYAAPPQYRPNPYAAPAQYRPNPYAAPAQYRPNMYAATQQCRTFLDPKKFKQKFFDVVCDLAEKIKGVNIKVTPPSGGPNIMLTVTTDDHKEYDIDLVPALETDFFQHAKLPTWMGQTEQKEMKEQPCYLVAKSWSGGEPYVQASLASAWILSFSRQEKYIIRSLPPNMKNAQRLLKKDLESYKESHPSVSVSSYHLKTVLLNLLEKEPDQKKPDQKKPDQKKPDQRKWPEVQTADMYKQLLEGFKKAIHDQTLHHHFLPEVNLFEGLQEQEQIDLWNWFERALERLQQMTAAAAAAPVVNTIVEGMLERLQDDPVFQDFRPSAMNIGSYYEELKVAHPNEFNVMLVFKIPIRHINVSDVRYVKVQFQEATYASGKSYHPLNEELLTTSKYGTFLDPEKFKKKFYDVVCDLEKDISGVNIQVKPPLEGAKIMLTVTTHDHQIYNIDLVLALETDFFSHAKLPTWMGRSEQKEMKEQPCYLVAKSWRRGERYVHASVAWRLSFPLQEKYIITSLPPNMKIAQRLLKKDLESYQFHQDGDPVSVSSYHLKTVLLNLLEKKPDQRKWAQVQTADMYQQLLTNFYMAIGCKTLHHHFLPEVNLLEGLQEEEKRKLLQGFQCAS